MIAEYERAQILERSRRGKWVRHRARAREVSVIGGAPYGYRYLRKRDDAPASYVVVEAEARVVRDIYEHYTVTGWSIEAICQWLNEQGVATRKADLPPLEPCRVAAGQTLGIAASHRPDQAAWSPRRSDARARGCRWRPERRVGAARGPLGLTRGGSLEDGRRTGGPGIVRRPRRRYRGRAPTRVLHTPSLSTDRLTGRPCGLPSTRPVENPRAGDGCYENGRDRAKAAPFDADQPGDSRLPPALFHAERTSARRTARGQQQGPQTRARRNHNEHEAGCFQAPRPLAAPLSDSRVPRTSSGGCGVASSCCPLPIPCGRCTGVFRRICGQN